MIDVQGQGGQIILDVDGQEDWGVFKFDKFHGRDMCIVPNTIMKFLLSWMKYISGGCLFDY